MGEQARDHPDPRASAGEVDRRRFLRRAAMVGTTVWAVPTIITVDVASASGITSPPPGPPSVEGDTVAPVAQNTSDPVPGAITAGRSELPRSGGDLDDIAMTGLVATAGGAALVLWSHTIES